MLPASVRVLPSESFVSEPTPEMIPERVWVADEEYLSEPAFAIAPEYEPEPKLPAPEICNVPADTVIAPVNVFAPFSTSVPALLSAGSISSCPVPVVIAPLVNVAEAPITCTVRSRFVPVTPLVIAKEPAST